MLTLRQRLCVYEDKPVNTELLCQMAQRVADELPHHGVAAVQHASRPASSRFCCNYNSFYLPVQSGRFALLSGNCG